MTNWLLSRLRIVLVEPAGPLNLGSVARVMKNMGLSQLILVNPHCHPHDDDARLMAVHAADVLKSARIVATLPEALVGCHRAVATTARDRDILDAPLEHPRHILPWLIGQQEVQAASSFTPQPIALESALIFGPEDRGLSNTELSYAQHCLRIPTSSLYPSLNLAQAVAICCYELYQIAIFNWQNAIHEDARESESGFPSSPLVPAEPAISPQLIQHSAAKQITVSHDAEGGEPLENSSYPAPLDDMEGFYQHLEATLLSIGYVFPHTADSRMKKFRRMFNRATLTTTEVSMLRGILRQVGWAMNHNKPDD
ncbi:MAG: RNA methyltransferase [Cyanobacteria bacterium P01_A01_bin.37]